MSRLASKDITSKQVMVTDLLDEIVKGTKDERDIKRNLFHDERLAYWTTMFSGSAAGGKYSTPPYVDAYRQLFDLAKVPANRFRQKLNEHRAAKVLLKVARDLLSGKLQIIKREVDRKNTDTLRSMKKLRAKSRGQIADSIEMAGYYAQKHNKSYYVYSGNSYGNAVWRVGDESEALSPINNTGSSVYMVAPDLEITKLTIKR